MKMTELSRRFEREDERVKDELRWLFFDDVTDTYVESDFFAKLCRREVRELESGFIALPQKLRAIAVHHAVLINRIGICKAVLCALNSLKMDINTDFETDFYGIPPLMTVCCNHCKRSFLTLVNDGGADLSVSDENGHTLARACVESLDLSFMQMAQKYGVSFDVSDPIDALIPFAAENNYYPALYWLIENLNGDANMTDEDEHSALDYACFNENLQIFLYLLDKGAKMMDKREALFNLIIDQIKELQKQPPSKIINARIHHHINTLHFLMTKA